MQADEAVQCGQFKKQDVLDAEQRPFSILIGDACREHRNLGNKYANAPVIMVTGQGNDQIIREAIRLGASN